MGPDYLLMGNVEPTDPMAMGTPETVYEHSKRAIEKAGMEGHFFLCGGCLISDEVPVDNLKAMIKAGHETVY